MQFQGKINNSIYFFEYEKISKISVNFISLNKIIYFFFLH